MDSQIVRCVIVGDGSVGKTCMLISYTQDKFPTEYVPTIFENYTCQVNIASKKITLNLMDTAGQEDYGELRQLSYPQADVFIIVFSVIEPASLENAIKKWYPELQRKNPKAKKIFAGNKIDLRDEDVDTHIKKQTALKAIEQIGCQYLECSALSQDGLKDVFDASIKLVSGPVKLEGKEGGCCNLI